MKKFSQLAIPYIAWAAMMLLFPMLLIAMYSVTDHGNSIISFSFTLEHYAKFFTDPDFLLVLWRSFVIAIKTTIICLLLGCLGASANLTHAVDVAAAAFRLVDHTSFDLYTPSLMKEIGCDDWAQLRLLLSL